MNRIAHICTGNISAWAGVAAALAAPVLLSVQRGSVGVVDETLAAVAQQSAELVQEVGAEAARTVQVAGRAVSVALCRGDLVYRAVCAEPFGSRAEGEFLIPATLVGLVGGEATFAVKGKRSQVMAQGLGPPGDSQAVSLWLQRRTLRKGRAGTAMPPSRCRADGSGATGPSHLSFGGCSPCGARLAGDCKLRGSPPFRVRSASAAWQLRVVRSAASAAS